MTSDNEESFEAGRDVAIAKTGQVVTIARKGPFLYGSITVPEDWVQLTKRIKHPINHRWTDMIHRRHLVSTPT